MEKKVSFKELISTNTPVLVDFYADWCAPCRMMSPILEQVAGEVKDEAKIVKINVDVNPAIAQAYHVMGIPTLILFQNGAVKWRQSGVQSAYAIKSAIQSLLPA